MDAPLVSVIIAYYKRAEIIERALQSVFEQDYPHWEVILVDNHSQDGLRDLLQTRFPQVQLVELSENRGACAARNIAIGKACGEVLIFLDDDAGFLSPSEMSKVVKILDERPGVHVLAFRICDPDTGALRLREWCHPRYWKDFSQSEFETNWFGEGASAFRRVVFDTCGLYYEPLFYGPEGWDLTLRMLERGFRILYTPQVSVWHRPSEAGRTLDRQYYYHTRDYIWMSYKDYRFPHGLRFLAPKMAMMVYFTLRSGRYGAFLRGVWDGVTGLKHVRSDRTPVGKATLRYLAGLEEWRPGWRVRLRKHKEKPSI